MTMISEIMEKIPLENKLKVSNEMAFIDLIIELGYREDKAWGDEEDELLGKLMMLAEKHTEYQLKLIAEEKAKNTPSRELYYNGLMKQYGKR